MIVQWRIDVTALALIKVLDRPDLGVRCEAEELLGRLGDPQAAIAAPGGVPSVSPEDLRPIEAANGHRQLMELNDWTTHQVAETPNVSKGAVSKAPPLLKLPEDAKERVEQGVTSPSSGYEVSRLKDERARLEPAVRIVSGGSSATTPGPPSARPPG